MFGPNVRVKETAIIILMVLFVIVNLIIFYDASTKLTPRGFSYLNKLEELVLETEIALANNDVVDVFIVDSASEPQETLSIDEVPVIVDITNAITTPTEQVADEFVIESELEESIQETIIATNPTVEHVSYPPDYATYRVISGDSLYWIAERFDTSVHELKDINGLKSEVIHTNQLLIVPISTLRTYPVGLSLTDKEVEWIAQMIHAEARGEPYIGQVAVGAVIINRLKNHSFPNTLREVLYQDRAFQPISNKSFYQSPSDVSRKAALEALNGNDPTGGALYFFNPSISSDRFMHSRKTTVTIGQHRFMR